MNYSEGTATVFGSRFREVDKVQERFRGVNVDHERKGAILVRMVGPSCRERGTVKLLAVADMRLRYL